MTLHDYFQQFVRHRTYVQNVTPKTQEWYVAAWRAFTRAQAGAPPRDPAVPLIGRRDLEQFALHLRERGVRPVSCNCWLRALNSFCRWLHEQGVTPDLVRLPPQRLEQRIIRTFEDASLRTLVRHRPTTWPHWRIHTLACTILDTGCRMQEVLLAPVAAFDLDTLLLVVQGKGRKERRVPFSVELRKQLVRWGHQNARVRIPSPLMFPARDGGRWHHRNARRDYYGLLARLGLPKTGFHHLRHTFATQYLRAGGDVVRLSLVLGHTEVSTTMKYAHLLTADLQAPHQRLSILNRLALDGAQGYASIESRTVY